jgi:hypothetical protein
MSGADAAAGVTDDLSQPLLTRFHADPRADAGRQNRSAIGRGPPSAGRRRAAGQAMTASMVFFSALGWAGDLGAFFRACSSLAPSS